MLTRLKSLTLVDQASNQLISYIEANDLRAGDSLPSIAQLAETFGASRAVIRESLKSLEAQGVIEICNGRRAKVRPISGEPLFNYFRRFLKVDDNAAWEFTEIRVALEHQCINLAIERGSDAELSSLNTLVNKMRENMNSAEDFAELDVQFHLMIAHATHNRTMVHLLESLRGAIRDAIREGLKKRLTPEQMEKVQLDHEKLVAAMLQRDQVAAQKALSNHFDELADLQQH